jgi:hypothetical protein
VIKKNEKELDFTETLQTISRLNHIHFGTPDIIMGEEYALNYIKTYL